MEQSYLDHTKFNNHENLSQNEHFKLGRIALKEGHYRYALDLFQSAAKEGHPQATYKMGLIYAEGLGVAQDLEKAYSYIEPRAAQGKLKAIRHVACFLLYGRGVNRNERKAAAMFQDLENKGKLGPLVSVAHDLAECYRTGTGVTQDYQKAFDLYQKAADHFNSDAIVSVGNFYRFGLCVPQNDMKAVSYYQTAANMGNIYGMYNLALAYKFGKGVAHDEAKYISLLQQAAENGCSEARARLITLNRT